MGAIWWLIGQLGGEPALGARFRRRELRGFGPATRSEIEMAKALLPARSAPRPIAALVDAATISQAEYSALLLRAGLGARLVGSKTNGTLGDVVTTTVPRTGAVCLLVSAGAAAAGSPLVARAGLAAPVILAAVLAIGAGVLILLLMPQSTGAGTGSLAGSLRQSTSMVLRGPIRRLLFVNFAAGVPLSAFLVTWQLDATDRVGLPPDGLGVILGLLMIAMAAGNFLAGVLVPRSSSRRTAMVGCGTMLVGGLAALAGSRPAPFIISLVIIEVGLGVFSGSFVSWVHDLADDDHRAAMTSAVLAVGSAAAAATTPVVGLLLERVGPEAAWGLAAGGAAVALVSLTGRDHALA